MRSEAPAHPATKPAVVTGRLALGAVTVALLWALCYPLITTAVRYAPPLHIGALRAVIAGCSLVIVGIALGRPNPCHREWLAIVGIGACSTSMGFAGMFLAGGRIGPGIATVIANTQPLLAAVIGYFALGERLVGWQGAGMVIAFMGIALVATPALAGSGVEGGAVTLPGVAYVLMGAVGVAAGNVIMKRFASRLDPLTATGWQLLVGGSLLFGVTALQGSPSSIEWSGPLLFALAGLAIPGTAIAFVLWFALIRRAPLNALNVFSFLTPVFALVIGSALYGERFGELEIAGTCLVIGGAWMAARRTRKHAQELLSEAERDAV